ncbi:hypothetical protein [Aquiflexum gelatinilyticum]|uniref:hypothetical protein n=1 Tax=Aquiflexum gelatinilyticum TaxID=2961943 RepID=UPI002169159E|nr:hypothetical protein [Aquiflexum gelatinilyticum]MCS4435002.1 hypothetical protein [Aquiflexum gelatinilyticum]
MKLSTLSFILILVLLSSCVNWDDQPVTGSVLFTSRNFPVNTEYFIAPAEVYVNLGNSPQINPWIRTGIVGTSFVVSDLLEGNYVIVAGGTVKTFQIVAGRQVEVFVQ